MINEATWLEFYEILRKEAGRNDDALAFSGDPRAGVYSSELERILDAHESGRANMIPRAWEKQWAAFRKKQDPDYQTYLELKARFEDG